MIDESDREYHMRRARDELDLAYRSDCRAAMESHLRLSALHMQRLRSPEAALAARGLAPLPRQCGGRVHVAGREQLAREVEAVCG